MEEQIKKPKRQRKPKIKVVTENSVEEKKTWRDITFKDEDGMNVKLGDVLTETDIFGFEVKRGDQVITKYKVSYEGIRRIARIAGIYGYDFDILVKPEIGNLMTTYLKITIHSRAGDYTKLGEASNENTSGKIAGKYKGIMAEKRGYERAVIEHLGLPNMYGESEFTGDEEEKEEKPGGLSPDEFKGISLIMNDIINATTLEILDGVAGIIKETSDKLSEKQLNHLRKLYEKRYNEIQSPPKF